MRKLHKMPAGLIVTPGASADREHATLVAIEDGIPEITVERVTLGTTSVKNAVAKIRTAAEELAKKLNCKPNEIAFGGRSFGGRACSVAVAEGLPAAALVLLSYPLHPPGKPDKLRTDHFPDVKIPSLFVSGDKDPFGTSDEFAEHVKAISGRVEFEWVPGGHSPNDQDDNIVALIRRFFGI